jgi:spermidine/putrescine transport system ATP-binding protein
MAESAVGISSVTKTFPIEQHKTLTALDDVSLTINNNEFFTLLGPSGCGKTTLLRLIAGFEYPSAGDITLFGSPIQNLPPHQRPVNTVFQQYALFPHMTVAENVGFGMEMLGRNKAERNKTVMRMLELVKMSEYASRKPTQLSGGQQQRVALARALAPHPKVLLLDEPLSALDLKLRQAMRNELKGLQRETGITFIFVTHDQEEALTMSDRIAVMSQGKVQQIGNPVEIYENPVNQFVANFIGETNILDATASSVQGLTVHCTLGSGTVEAYSNKPVRQGDTIKLSLRPEKIRLLPPGEKGNLSGQILETTYLGTDTTYKIKTGDLFLDARDPNALSGSARFKPGDGVSLHIAPNAAKVLHD